MRKAKKTNNRYGVCRICGTQGQLTYEHLPPKAAINDFQQEEYGYFEGNQLINSKKGRYTSKQKGTGDYYLCHNCNNNTGAYYGDAFKIWARQIFTATYEDKKEKGTLEFKKYKFYPLRVFKQIISMFLCIDEVTEKAGFKAKEKQIKLKEFVLEKESLDFPNDINIYFYAHSPYSTMVRQIPYTVIADPLETLEEFTGSEISMYGSGYILTKSKNINKLKIIEADNLIDITFFKNYSYDEEIKLELKIPVLPNHTLNLCDFRIKEGIDKIVPDNHVVISNFENIKGIKPR